MKSTSPTVLIAVFGVATLVGGFPQNKGTEQPPDSLQETPVEMFNRSDADKDERLTFDEFLHTDLLYEQLKRDEFNALDADREFIYDTFRHSYVQYAWHT